MSDLTWGSGEAGRLGRHPRQPGPRRHRYRLSPAP